MTSLINHLLAHHLSTNESVLINSTYILNLLQSERIISKCEIEEGLGGPVMNRWNSRLASLVAPSLLPPIRTIGFQLLISTFTSSDNVLLSQSKPILAIALNYVSIARPDPTLYLESMKIVILILARSTWHIEWARDVVGAAVVQRTVQSLLNAANGTISEIKIPSINAIVSLIPLFPTPLRPLSPALHTLAYDSLCDSNCSIALLDAGAALFVSLYLLAPKGRDGLRDAWRKGVEALIGSIDTLVLNVTSDIFAEDPLTNYTLSSLALPPLVNSSPVTALCRLEALTQVLCCSLRTPTAEKAGPVEVPIGALIELGVRLVGLSIDMPVKERTDPTTLTHTLSLLPRLQVSGCQLLAQIALCAGPRMVSHATEVLTVISRTLSTYILRSPMRPTLSTTYSIIHSALGPSIDSEDGAKSLARVWRSVLEDIGSVAVQPSVVAVSEDKSRKSKRQKTYDPSESMDLAGRRVRLDEIDLAIATRGLATLERLLASPHSHFLPPKLQLATCRLLLAISLDPAFFSSHSASTESPTFFPATSASKGLDIAKQSDEFRRGVVSSLKTLLEGSSGGTSGLPERAIEVWRKGCTDSDEIVKEISILALNKFSNLIHPALPPLQINTTFERLKQERLGGIVGDDISIMEGAEEFRLKDVEVEEAEEMLIEDDSNNMNNSRSKEEVSAQPTVVSSAFPTSSSNSSFPTSFSSSGFPSFTSKISDDQPSTTISSTTIVSEEKTTTILATSTIEQPSFISLSTNSTSTTTNTKGKNVRPAASMEEDSDDDEFVMPKIVDDSSDEE